MKKFTPDEFRAAARRGDQAGGIVLRASTADAPQPQADSRRVRFVFSDATVDRAGDTIDPRGWDLADFNRNPIALWSHDGMSPPIGRASNVGVIGDRLIGDIEFPAPEISEDADKIYKLVRGGFIKGVSVGFLPVAWKMSSDPKRPLGIDFLRQKLIEISVCGVPCNPNSLAQARAVGLDTSAIERMPAAGAARVVEARKIRTRLFLDCGV